MSALVIDRDVVARLVDLRARAGVQPINVRELLKTIESPVVEAAYREAMSRLTIEIPVGFTVTFSVETGHPAGVCRHMSMASSKPGRAPTSEGLWMVAEHLGFVGSLPDCRVWLEDLRSGGKAINIVQPISMTTVEAAGRA
jgi:hypothetical protein